MSILPMTRFPLIPSAARAAGFFLLSLLLAGAKVDPLPGEILKQDAVTFRAEGRQFQDAGEMERASAAYRRALTLNPGYAEAYNDLGVALESMGDLANAEKAYQEALLLKPDFAAAHSNLALLYEEAGRKEEAAEHWTARIRLGPPDDPWVLRAREKMERHKIPVLDTPKQAAQKQQQAVKLAILAGQTHMDAKRWDDAIREFERALELEPGNSKANRYLNVARLKAAEAERKLGREMERSHQRVLREKAAADREQAALERAERKLKTLQEGTQRRHEEIAREKKEGALQRVEERKKQVQPVRRAESAGPRRPWWKFWAGDPERRRRQEVERAAEQARRLQEAQEEALRKAEGMLSGMAASKPQAAPAPEPPKPRAPAPAPVRAVAPVAPVQPPAARPETSVAEARRLAEEYARSRAERARDSRGELYRRGVAGMREGDYMQAAEHFRQILALDPGDVEAQQALARAERAWEKEQQDQGQGDF